MMIGKILGVAGRPAAALVLATGLTAGAAGSAFAKDAGDLTVRLRGTAFLTQTDGTTDVLGGDAEAGNDYKPELDFTYFFTRNIAAELILATFQHDVTVDNSTAGNLDLGDVWSLPPTLTAQYHPLPDSAFSPYLGAGLTYLIMYNADAGSSVTSVDYSNELGVALQAGLDYQLEEAWSLNLDVKKIFVDTDIAVNGGAINANDTDLDPWVISVGVGYTF